MKTYKDILTEAKKSTDTKVNKDDVVAVGKSEKDDTLFVVAKRDTSGMRGNQDKFNMCITDKNYNIIEKMGSHPSKSGAIGFGKNQGYKF